MELHDSQLSIKNLHPSCKKKQKSKHKKWLVVRKTGFHNLQMISGEEKIRSKKYQM